MTAIELALYFHAKRAGKDKWIARCPIHGDRRPSLSIVRRDKGRTSIHCFAGCPISEVMEAVGLRVSDVFEDAGMTPESKQRMRDEADIARLERRGALVAIMAVVEPELVRYWRAAYRRILADRRVLVFRLYPERRRMFEVYQRIKHVGIDRMWEDIP